MTRKRNMKKNPIKQTKKSTKRVVSLDFIKDFVSVVGGLAGSIMAIYGFIKTFKDNVEGFSWLIIFGIIIWLIILKQLFQTRRNIAYGLLFLSLVGGVIGWFSWQSQVMETEKKVIVLVAQFDGPEETYGLQNQILEDLRLATQEYDDIVIIDGGEIVTVGQGSEYARELGLKAKADLVIWAWYRPTENPNITIHFENMSTIQTESFKKSESCIAAATRDQLESFEIQKEIGSGTSSLIVFIAGMLKYESGDYEDAVRHFEQVLNMDEVFKYVDYFRIFSYLGNLYFALGNYELAIFKYSSALEIDPQNSDIYLLRGVNYHFLEEYNLAIQDYDKAIKFNSQNVCAYVNRGSSFVSLNQIDRSIQIGRASCRERV